MFWTTEGLIQIKTRLVWHDPMRFQNPLFPFEQPIFRIWLNPKTKIQSKYLWTTGPWCSNHAFYPGAPSQIWPHPSATRADWCSADKRHLVSTTQQKCIQTCCLQGQRTGFSGAATRCFPKEFDEMLLFFPVTHEQNLQTKGKLTVVKCKENENDMSHNIHLYIYHNIEIMT